MMFQNRKRKMKKKIYWTESQLPNYIASQLITNIFGSFSIRSILCNWGHSKVLKQKQRSSKEIPDGRWWIENTCGIMVECWKNQVIHVHPNCTSPIRCIVLCIVLHVQWATTCSVEDRISPHNTQQNLGPSKDMG